MRYELVIEEIIEMIKTNLYVYYNGGKLEYINKYLESKYLIQEELQSLTKKVLKDLLLLYLYDFRNNE